MNLNDAELAINGATADLKAANDEYVQEVKAALQSLKERDEEMAYELQNGDGREHWIMCGCGVVRGENRPCAEHRRMRELVREYERD